MAQYIALTDPDSIIKRLTTNSVTFTVPIHLTHRLSHQIRSLLAGDVDIISHRTIQATQFLQCLLHREDTIL